MKTDNHHSKQNPGEVVNGEITGNTGEGTWLFSTYYFFFFHHEVRAANKQEECLEKDLPQDSHSREGWCVNPQGLSFSVIREPQTLQATVTDSQSEFLFAHRMITNYSETSEVLCTCSSNFILAIFFLTVSKTNTHTHTYTIKSYRKRLRPLPNFSWEQIFTAS